MIRLFGAGILVLCAWICGFAAAKTEGEKLRAADALCGFVKRLERGISSARTPLKELFARESDEYLERAGFLPVLRSGGVTGELWESALAKLPLGEEIYPQARAFGRELGTLGLSDQCAAAKAFCLALEEEREKLAKSLPLKQKSLRAAFLLFGLFAAIILI
ncbi:MAG: hypothetical protein J5925_02525 [Clostridia bacterium]|nr:hypothetical protein [Clostridia bacterium]MBR4799327.1 hypothetical protein [Clostridia bacterium]